MKNKIQLFILGIALTLFLFIGFEMVSAEPTGWALSFDGIDDYAVIPDDESLGFGSGDFSMEVWIKSETINSERGIIHKGVYWDPAWIILQDAESEGNFYGFYVSDGVNWGVIDSTTIADGSWKQITGVKKNDELKIYVNGVEEGNKIVAGLGSPDTNEDLVLGSEEIGTYFADCEIDELRIYNRALTDNEISEHYIGIYNNETGLVGYWDFNEGEGTTIIDNSGLGNHGTIYGAIYEEIPEPEPEPEPTGVITAGFEGNMPETAIASTTAFIGDLFSSTGILIYLFIGIPFAFFIIFEIIGMIKDRFDPYEREMRKQEKQFGKK